MLLFIAQDKIRSNRTRQEAAMDLLDIMERKKSPDNYFAMMKGLMQSGQQHLAEKIDPNFCNEPGKWNHLPIN